MINKPLPTVSANGLTLPVLGQGGWNLGDDPARADDEKAALRHGLTLGLTLIDTAEMYGDGRSEYLIGQALADISRDSFQLCSKVYPHNAGRPTLIQSCDASLRRLNTDYLDLYLLHWPGDIPLAETVNGMEELIRAGKIRRWGVSNFDVGDMEALWRTPGGDRCAVNQVLYHLGSRGVEYDLLPWLRTHNVAMMAYCPLAQGGTLRRTRQDFLTDPTLCAVAQKYNASIMQVMLAFVLRQQGVTAIPKAGHALHVEQNAQALTLNISLADWQAIDDVFWPPSSKMHLDIE